MSRRVSAPFDDLKIERFKKLLQLAGSFFCRDGGSNLDFFRATSSQWLILSITGNFGLRCRPHFSRSYQRGAVFTLDNNGTGVALYPAEAFNRIQRQVNNGR
jgi:hypothetical protein